MVEPGRPQCCSFAVASSWQEPTARQATAGIALWPWEASHWGAKGLELEMSLVACFVVTVVATVARAFVVVAVVVGWPIERFAAIGRLLLEQHYLYSRC